MTAITDQLAQALQRLARNFDLLLAGKAVRDVSETQAEVTAALAAYDAAPDDDAKDAARYRWLRDSRNSMREYLAYDEAERNLLQGEALDAAIDAARSKP
jgi:hypothetical protein